MNKIKVEYIDIYNEKQIVLLKPLNNTIQNTELKEFFDMELKYDTEFVAFRMALSYFCQFAFDSIEEGSDFMMKNTDDEVFTILKKWVEQSYKNKPTLNMDWFVYAFDNKATKYFS